MLPIRSVGVERKEQLEAKPTALAQKQKEVPEHANLNPVRCRTDGVSRRHRVEMLDDISFRDEVDASLDQTPAIEHALIERQRSIVVSPERAEALAIKQQPRFAQRRRAR
jgi:hypothetical protein